MGRRVDHLVEEDLARRQGQRVIFGRDLLDTLRQRELDDAVARLSAETGLAHRPSAEGEQVAGVLSSAHHPRFGSVRHDRRWARISVGALATRFGAATRETSRRRYVSCRRG